MLADHRQRIEAFGDGVSEAANWRGRTRSADSEFAAGLAQLALAMQRHAQDDAEPLDFITSGAVDLIPGAEGAALVRSSDRTGQLTGRAACGFLAAPTLDVQNSVGEGPCFDAVAGVAPVLTQDLQNEVRWPTFTPGAALVGVRSMLCTPLEAGGRIYGSLSLLSSQPDVFDEESQELATVFATHAAIALSAADFRRSIGVALNTRDVIGQAKGILMERFQVTPDTAFAILVRLSQQLNRKLRDVSAQLCDTGQLPSEVSRH